MVLRLWLVSLALLPLVPQSSGTDLFDTIHNRSRIEERQLRSARGQFTETTVSTLLVEPVVARGRLALARPNRLVLVYDAPESKIILMDGSRLAVVWPARKTCEQMDIGEIQRRVQEYFAGAAASEVRRHFSVQAFPDRDMAGAYRIEMTPKRKQIQQGLEGLRIWINRDTLVLMQMQMLLGGGDSHTFTLHDVLINAPVDDREFAVDLSGCPAPANPLGGKR
jgi:outer membrane lipoprotein-sorting protein